MRIRWPAAILAAALTILISTAAAPATHLTSTGSPGGPKVPWGFNEDWGWPPPGYPS